MRDYIKCFIPRSFFPDQTLSRMSWLVVRASWQPFLQSFLLGRFNILHSEAVNNLYPAFRHVMGLWWSGAVEALSLRIITVQPLTNRCGRELWACWSSFHTTSPRALFFPEKALYQNAWMPSSPGALQLLVFLRATSNAMLCFSGVYLAVG